MLEKCLEIFSGPNKTFVDEWSSFESLAPLFSEFRLNVITEIDFTILHIFCWPIFGSFFPDIGETFENLEAKAILKEDGKKKSEKILPLFPPEKRVW